MKKLRSSPISLIFILLTIIPFVNAKSPVRARSTMLSLYTKSDIIAVGRFDKKEEAGTNRVNDGFTIVTTKTYFDISSVLKGEPQKFVVIENEEFRYQVQKGNDVPRTTTFVDSNNSREDDIKPGDTVLLFLKKDGESITLADERDGIRQISAEQQNAYSDRIKELNAIFDSKEIDNAKIATWLVRCVKDPVTRWDGTHELLQGFRQLEWREVKDDRGYERVDPSVSFAHGSEAAQSLTDDLKAALTQILISSDFSSQKKSSELSDGDRELINLVKRWDPSTAARYLIGQLKSGAFTTHENAGMMFKVAELIADDRAAQIWKQYLTAGDQTQNVATVNDPHSVLMKKFISSAEEKLAQLSIVPVD